MSFISDLFGKKEKSELAKEFSALKEEVSKLTSILSEKQAEAEALQLKTCGKCGTVTSSYAIDANNNVLCMTCHNKKLNR